jgi:hypothetical protein
MTPALYDAFDEVKDSCDRHFGECLFTVYKLSRPTIVFTDQYELFRARVKQFCRAALTLWKSII